MSSRRSFPITMLCILAMNCAGNRTQGRLGVDLPKPIQERIRLALDPLTEEELNVQESDSDHFPGVKFYLARREPPAGPGGFEDPRPVFVTVATTSSDTIVLISLEDAEVLWSALAVEYADPDTLQSALLDLLDVTLLVPADRVLSEKEDLVGAYTDLLRNPEAVARVKSPAMVRLAGGWEFTFYSTSYEGLWENTFTLSPMNELSIQRQQLSRYKVEM